MCVRTLSARDRERERIGIGTYTCLLSPHPQACVTSERRNNHHYMEIAKDL